MVEDHGRGEHVVTVCQWVSATSHKGKQGRGNAVDPIGGAVRITIRVPPFGRTERRQDIEWGHRTGAGGQQLPPHAFAHRAKVGGTETRALESLAPEIRLLRSYLRPLSLFEGIWRQPGSEIIARKRREIEEQIHHVALEVYHQKRNTPASELLEGHDAEAGLSRSCHPHTNRVSCQMIHIERGAPISVDFGAKVEVVVSHPALQSSLSYLVGRV